MEQSLHETVRRDLFSYTTVRTKVYRGVNTASRALLPSLAGSPSLCSLVGPPADRQHSFKALHLPPQTMDGVRGAKPTVLQTSSYGVTYEATACSEATEPHGILLVVAQGGHRIAYHYPAASTRGAGGSSGIGGNGGGGRETGASDDVLNGFDPQILADLVLPKPALFEQVFDLTVGARRLIGWPVKLESQHKAIPGAGAAGVALKELKDGDVDEDGAAQLRALSVVFVLSAQPLAGDEARYARVVSGCKSAADQLAHALQREELCSRLVSMHIASAAVPADISDGINGTVDDSRSAGCGSNGCGEGGATAFGASTTALSATASPPRCRIGINSSVAAAAPAAAVKSSCFHSLAAPPSSEAESTAGGRARSSQFGELGAVLRATLLALQGDQPVTLRVGTNTDVAVCAPEPPPPPPKLASVAGGMPPPPPLRPYLALLPLEDPARIAKQLPSDASPLLMRLVHAANPLRSLEQLADETGIPMPMIFALSTHLQQWNKVRIIHPLTQDSVLCVQPDAPYEPSESYQRLYGSSSEAEPIPPYHVLLSLFSSAQRFGSVIRTAEQIHLPKRRLVQITITLLQCDVLRPLLTYIHCVSEPPEPARSTAAATNEKRGATAEEFKTAAVYSAEADEHYAMSLSLWRLYRRLRPMLYGEHHLEEIMWQERLSRDVLDELLKAYDRHLVAVATFEVDVGRLGARGYTVGPNQLPAMQ